MLPIMNPVGDRNFVSTRKAFDCHVIPCASTIPLVQRALLMKTIINIITGIIETQMPSLIKIINFVADTVGKVLNAVMRDIQPWLNSLIQMFDGFATFLNGIFTLNFKMAWEGIVQMLKGFVNTIITYVQGTVNAIIQLINTVVEGAIKLANLIPNVDFNTNVAKIPEINIPLLAEGGVITGEGQAIVGEAGAELLTLPKGASVKPLDNTSTLTKDDLVDAFVEAFNRVGINVTVNGNENNLFDVVVKKNTVYKRTHGGVSAI